MDPAVRYRRSYVAAMREESDFGYRFDRADQLDDRRAFAWYVDQLLADRREESPRPEGYVPNTMLWWVQGRTYLGRVNVRHRLTPELLRYGGHVGYWIRPSARGRGHGRAAFRAALPVAARLGIDPALVTCNRDNVASRRIIEGADGTPDAPYGTELRFWVPTGRPSVVSAEAQRAKGRVWRS